MTFSEKIDKILITNKINLRSTEELSEFCGFHRDTIRKALPKKSGINPKNTRILLDKLNISQKWWKHDIEPIYNEKPTRAPKSEQADILDDPLVKNFVEQINLQKEFIEVLKRENADLRRQLGK